MTMTHILNFDQRPVYICASVSICSLTCPEEGPWPKRRNIFIVNNFWNAFNHQSNFINIFLNFHTNRRILFLFQS